MNKIIHKIFIHGVVLAFLINTVLPVPVYGQLSSLPPVGAMIQPTFSFAPVMIKGIKIFPDNPLRFDFIVDTGDSGLDSPFEKGGLPKIRENLKDDTLKKESKKLIKYFLAALTTPEEDMWVNLSPYEKDRIIPKAFGQTEMGLDLLAQDYILKQLTASLMYPEEELGKQFWQQIYQKAYEQYGTTEISVNTFNKVWIMPEKAVVYENENTAYVVESRLKVMLEEDYLAITENDIGIGAGSRPARLKTTDNQLRTGLEPVSTGINFQTQIIREIIIPAIEKEVNQGEHFAQLRQIYHALILATWFKKKLVGTGRDRSLLGQIYVDQNKIVGVDVEDKQIKDKIYQQYLEAFKNGVYSYIKEDIDPATQEIVPRKYFSGGFGIPKRFKTDIEIVHNVSSPIEPDGAFILVANRLEKIRGQSLTETRPPVSLDSEALSRLLLEEKFLESFDNNIARAIRDQDKRIFGKNPFLGIYILGYLAKDVEWFLHRSTNNLLSENKLVYPSGQKWVHQGTPDYLGVTSEAQELVNFWGEVVEYSQKIIQSILEEESYPEQINLKNTQKFIQLIHTLKKQGENELIQYLKSAEDPTLNIFLMGARKAGYFLFNGEGEKVKRIISFQKKDIRIIENPWNEEVYNHLFILYRPKDVISNILKYYQDPNVSSLMREDISFLINDLMTQLNSNEVSSLVETSKTRTSVSPGVAAGSPIIFQFEGSLGKFGNNKRVKELIEKINNQGSLGAIEEVLSLLQDFYAVVVDSKKDVIIKEINRATALRDADDLLAMLTLEDIDEAVNDSKAETREGLIRYISELTGAEQSKVDIRVRALGFEDGLFLNKNMDGKGFKKAPEEKQLKVEGYSVNVYPSRYIRNRQFQVYYDQIFKKLNEFVKNPQNPSYQQRYANIYRIRLKNGHRLHLKIYPENKDIVIFGFDSRGNLSEGSSGKQLKSGVKNYFKKISNYSIDEMRDKLVPVMEKFSSPLGNENLGGIDFNPNSFDLGIQGQGFDYNAPIDPQLLESLISSPIGGFIPVIINITPIINLPQLLGLNGDRENVPVEQSSFPKEELWREEA